MEIFNKKHLFSLLLLLPTSLFAYEIPDATGDRIENAISLSESHDFVGSYVMTTISSFKKPKKDKETKFELVIRMTQTADGTYTSEYLKLIEDGEDKTEEAREEGPQSIKIEPDSEPEEEVERSLRLPYHDDAVHYDFETLQNGGDLVAFAFKPKPEFEDTEGVIEGSIAWDPTTEDPVWFEYRFLEPPKPMLKLWARMEYGRIQGEIYMESMYSTGLIKILLMKREFKTDVFYTEITPPVSD